MFYLRALLELAGLRGIEEFVEGEARKMPLLNSILDNKVLGREFRRGHEELLRHMLEGRFGALPRWAEERLARCSTKEFEDLGVRLLETQSLEELFK